VWAACGLRPLVLQRSPPLVSVSWGGGAAARAVAGRGPVGKHRSNYFIMMNAHMMPPTLADD
jgi:hypothetical protein